jgi:hypothetical protein
MEKDDIDSSDHDYFKSQENEKKNSNYFESFKSDDQSENLKNNDILEYKKPSVDELNIFDGNEVFIIN